MLNPFPSLLSYGFFAPFLLRVVLGLIFIDLGALKFKGEKARWIASFEALHIGGGKMVSLLGAIEVVGGLMLLAGWNTQIAALAFAIITGVEMYTEWRDDTLLRRNFTFYLLLFVIALSLLLTGAGAYAFDIPL